MNSNPKKRLLKSVLAILVIGCTTPLVSIANPDASSIGVNYHNGDSARVAYEDYVNGGDDPFYDATRGYMGMMQQSGIGLSEVYQNQIISDLKQETSSLVSEQAYINQSRASELASIYRESIGEDGLDIEGFNSLYDEFKESKRESNNEAFSLSTSTIISVLNQNGSELRTSSHNINTQSSTGIRNLVGELQSHAQTRKLALHQRFTSASIDASDAAATASSTIAITQTFAEGCGSACMEIQPPTTDIGNPDEPVMPPPLPPIDIDEDFCPDEEGNAPSRNPERDEPEPYLICQ